MPSKPRSPRPEAEGDPSPALGRKPRWLRVPPPWGGEFRRIRSLVEGLGLHTVCCEARCPNIGECYCSGTATFLILGKVCTRHCRFCNIVDGRPSPVDEGEAERLAEAAVRMKLSFVVITSVTRDDLPDGGASHFARCLEVLHRRLPEAGVEVLIPDFQGDDEALATVLAAKPSILNHNLETVPRLYEAVRPEARFDRSLRLLARSRELAPEIETKSGLMLGLGEEAAELESVLGELRSVGCRRLTLGQYLPPSGEHAPLHRYVSPEEFEGWKLRCKALGFTHVESSPLVRSSYHARSMAEAKETP